MNQFIFYVVVGEHHFMYGALPFALIKFLNHCYLVVTKSDSLYAKYSGNLLVEFLVMDISANYTFA